MSKFFYSLIIVILLPISPLVAENSTHTLIKQMFDGVEWVNDTKFVKSYDGNQNLLSERTFLWISGKWSLYTGNDYKYSNKNVIEEVFSGIREGEFVQTKKITYKYDKKGKNYLIEDFSGKSSNWTLVYKYRMYYNTSGKLTKRVMYEQYGDSLLMNFKTMYYYDDLNREIKMEYYSLLDTVAHILERSITEYSGNSAITISKSMENYGWRNRTKEIKIYDNKDSLLTHTTLVWADNEWVQSEKIENEYDSIGNLIKHTQSQFDFDKWVPEKRISSSYSGKRLVSKLEEKMYRGNWIKQYRTLEPSKINK